MRFLAGGGDAISGCHCVAAFVLRYVMRQRSNAAMQCDVATWQRNNAITRQHGNMAMQHSRLDQSADGERLPQPRAEQVVKFMRHFGFEFDRCMDVVSAKACLFGADDVVDDIGQEDAAYREELIGKGRQTADIGRRLRPDRTYICLIREYVWLFPRDCAAWKQLETGPPCALPLNTAMGVPVHTGQILVIWR
ncbi:MAG: hypothetical protein E7E87_00015 [Bifidobacterium breve]|nr:hypothetical protein [Bifidobacterium breve]MDU3740191.1 hypothetical protein [Bifidobacterium breve]